MKYIDQLKEIIQENNYFDTLPGKRFKEWNGITDIESVISFSGRSRTRKSYRLSAASDSDQVYVTHLYIDRCGDVMVQLGIQDDDDFAAILHPSRESAEDYDQSILKEWVDLLTI